MKDNDDDSDEDASAGFLPSEDCLHAQAIISVLQQVHPEHHMSKNCQFSINDILECLMYTTFGKIVGDKGGMLSPENVIAVIPKVLDGQLVKFATAECENTQKPLFADNVRKYLEDHFAGITITEAGLVSASKLFEYCMAELLELAGNISKDEYLRCIHPHHVFNIDDDELEKSFLELICMGTASRKNLKNIVFRNDMGIFTNDSTNHDYFQQVQENMDYKVSSSHSIHYFQL